MKRADQKRSLRNYAVVPNVTPSSVRSDSTPSAARQVYIKPSSLFELNNKPEHPSEITSSWGLYLHCLTRRDTTSGRTFVVQSSLMQQG